MLFLAALLGLSAPGALASYPDQQFVLEGADSLLAGATSIVNIVRSPDGRAIQLADGSLSGSIILQVQSAPFPFDIGLPSWNGSAPGDSGGFRVLIRVPYGTGWSPWLEVGYWKANLWPGTKPTTFAGGRIDIDTVELSFYATSWQFKIEMKRLAASVPSPTVRLLSFVASDSRTTAEFDLSAALADRPPAIFIPTTFLAQYKISSEFGGRICSPTTVAMILLSYGISVDPLPFALDTYDPYWGIFGVWPRVVQNAAEHGLRGTVARIRSWSQAYDVLAKGGRIGMSVGPPLYSGHLMMVAGFTASGDPIVHDPARSSDGYAHVFNKADLSKSWFEKGGVAYVFSGIDVPSTAVLACEQGASGAPASFVFYPAYPNPFPLSRDRSGVTLMFDLPAPEVVSVSVYNAVGQLVQQLASQEYAAGLHAVRWQPDQDVGPGVYFLRVAGARQVATGRCVLIR
jgi:hypothetical protein